MQNNKIPIITGISDRILTATLNEMMAKTISTLILSEEAFYLFIKIMFIVGLFVFIALFFIQAGYGKFQKSSKIWNILVIPNKIAWVLMECPVFIVMLFYYLSSYKEGRQISFETLTCFLLFQLHYFQRSFIFPLLIKGKSKMPISIMLMGAVFNTCNGILQGNWLFNISSENFYDDLFISPSFYLGLFVFFSGMIINIHSDHVIRTLRKPGDTNHYLPQRGMYRFVTSANYLGEIIEWTGYAILTRSISGVLFVFWSIANLVPRAFSIYNLYLKEFGEAVLTKKRIIPFIL